MQKPFIFKRKKMIIMGTLHLPDGKTKFPGVLLCHGFTGNKIEPHRLFWKISKQLEKSGIASLRFDYRGCGESEGNSEDFTIKDYIGDAKMTMKRFVKKVKGMDINNISVIGLSMGGIIASYLTAEFDFIKKLVLLSAVAKPKEVFWNGFKNNHPQFKEQYEQGIIDAGGNAVSKKFLDETRRLKPLKKVKDFKGKALIIHSEADETVSLDNAEAYENAIKNSKKIVIPGDSHTFNNLKDEKMVIDSIIKFIK